MILGVLALPAIVGQQVLPETLTGASGSGFGFALAVLGDVNADRVPDLAVGAPCDSATGTRAGCVFVVSGKDGALVARCPGRGEGDQLGSSVRSGADLDGDGLYDVIAHAGIEGLSIRLMSARDGSAIPSIPRDTVFAGRDFDGDGVNDRLDALLDVAAYVYSGKVGGKVLRQFPEQRPGGHLEGFGASVAWAGDLDRDGVQDVAVGCLEWMDATSSYYVALFSGRDAKLLHLLDSNQAMTVVGEAADFDSDGFPDLPVGIPEHEQVLVLDGRKLASPDTPRNIGSAEWPVLRTLRRADYPPVGPGALPTPPAPR